MKEVSILKIAHSRDFVLLEEEWMALLEKLPESLDDMLATVEWLIKITESERAELLLSTLLEALEEQKPGNPALKAAKKSLELFPENLNIRKVFARQFLICNSRNPAAETILKKSEIVSSKPYSSCLEYINKRLNLVPGAYVIHIKRRFPARVESYNPETDTLTLNNGEQTYETDFATYSEQYNGVSEMDFRALQVFDHETLSNLASVNPVELVKIYLKAEGGQSVFRDFKDAVTFAAVPKDRWKKWWHDTHKLLVMDPFIDLGTGGQPSLALRDTPRDFSQALRKDFDYAENLREKPVMVLKYISEIKNGVPPNEELLSHFQSSLAEIISSEKDEVLAFVSWLALCDLNKELKTELPGYSPGWLNSQEKIIAYSHWCGGEHIVYSKLLTFLPEKDENWPDLFKELLPYAPLPLVELLASFLIKNNKTDKLSAALQKIKEPDIDTAEAFAWLWKTVVEKVEIKIELDFDVKDLTMKLFKLIQRLSKAKEHEGQNIHNSLAALRHTVSAKKYTLIQSAFNEFGREKSSELYHFLTSNTGLSSAMRSQLVRLL